MQNYLDLVAELLELAEDGEPMRGDRTGTGTFGVFGRSLRFDLGDGFPLLTAKRTHWKSVLGELLWFVDGSCNNLELRDRYGVTIWEEWAHSETGDLGPIYGVQWRSWYGADGTAYDQLDALVQGIREDPFGRRHLVSAWNVAELDQMALPPCHYSFQCHVDRGRVSMLVNMRSSDVFLGLPFNIASYAALTHMIGHVTGYAPGDLIMNLGDTHLYSNHVEAADKMLAQAWNEGLPELPAMNTRGYHTSLDSFGVDDFELLGYNPLPGIKAPVAV